MAGKRPNTSNRSLLLEKEENARTKPGRIEKVLEPLPLQTFQRPILFHAVDSYIDLS